MFRLQSEKKVLLTPGKYISTVLNVYDHPEYVSGSAVKINYELKDEAGNLFNFEEVYITIGNNTRTKTFCDYLREYGIEEWADLVGCMERVTLLKNPGKYKTFLKIAEREFIMEEEQCD